MALMERIATLLRANLNDLLERAEDPEKLLKQLALDMENHMMQLKTQVAVSLADQHLLEKKAREQEATVADWHGKAELAVKKGEDALARAALERALVQERTLAAYRTQVAEQAAESEALRSTYTRLQGKLAETKVQCELLSAQHRRAQMVARATQARDAVEHGSGHTLHTATVARLQSRIETTEARNYAARAMLAADVPGSAALLEDRLTALAEEDQVEKMLAELKGKQTRRLAAG